MTREESHSRLEASFAEALKDQRRGLTYRQQSKNIIKNLPKYGLKIEVLNG